MARDEGAVMKDHLGRVWGSVLEEWQVQVKRAALAAVVAGGTVMLAPILNALKHHQPHHKPHAKPHGREGSWADREHARHSTHHRGR